MAPPPQAPTDVYSLAELRSVKSVDRTNAAKVIHTNHALLKDLPEKEAYAQELLRLGKDPHIASLRLLRRALELPNTTPEQAWEKLPNAHKKHLLDWADNSEAVSPRATRLLLTDTTFALENLPRWYAVRYLTANPERITDYLHQIHLDLSNKLPKISLEELNRRIFVHTTPEFVDTHYARYQLFLGDAAELLQGMIQPTWTQEQVTHAQKLITHLNGLATEIAKNRIHRGIQQKQNAKPPL